MARRIDVVGGGPAGLYVARLLKLRDPSLDITVYERHRGNADTFGFGVGLTESTMRNLESADAETAEQVRAASFAGHDLRLKARDSTVMLHGARNLAIGRATLLGILAKAARVAGVDVRTGCQFEASTSTADVVIGADGVRSATREKFAAEFGVRTRRGRLRFVWCGTDFAVDSSFFTAVERGSAMFVAHAYPYASDRSTFLIEVDDETWRTVGLDDYDQRTPAGQTDEASINLLQQVFIDELDGHRLLTNRTRWDRFTNLDLDRWSVDNVVLMGDSAHTAHYTLGSGTKLALEDAIALAEALTGDASVVAAAAAYEQARRPPVERFKRRAARSQAWWDTYRMRSRWPAERQALSYMTRSGNLTLADYAADQPSVVRRALDWLGPDAPVDGPDVHDWVLSQPLRDAVLALDRRLVSPVDVNSMAPVDWLQWDDDDVWSETADHSIAWLKTGGDVPVILTGPNDVDRIPARIDFAERIRLQTPRLVGVQLPDRERAQAATAVAAGRADFIAMP